MKRKAFLQQTGLAGIAALLPFSKLFSTSEVDSLTDACTDTPGETAGPYPWDLSGSATYYRSDITEGKTGIPLALTITVLNSAANCSVVSNARVDIWHCDKDGYYSEYSGQPGVSGTKNYANQSWLRGIQLTAADGTVAFTTIYPGWYVPRATHIHAEVFINSVNVLTTQMAFDDAISAEVYATTLYSLHGQNNTTNSKDMVFGAGQGQTTTEAAADLALETLAITGNTTDGYKASITLVIDNAVLPLHLLSFNAGIQDGKVAVWWTTTNEVNVNKFIVERSIDAEDFTAIGTVLAKNGAGNNNYTFTDTNNLISGKYFYRISMVDNDGKSTYSSNVPVDITKLQKFRIYPNPAKNNIVVTHGTADGASFIRIITMDGNDVITKTVQAGSLTTSVDIAKLAKGNYLVNYITKSGKQVTKLIKQ